jgi:2-polyprenyl-3-methyl-5-hydroxy-6-metoxy-1,4-benzoquinol methylase
VTVEELCENVEEIEKYDAIIASEVIEHINDVDSFIENLSKLLKVQESKFFFSSLDFNFSLKVIVS